MKEECNRRPRCISNHSYSNINSDTLPLSDLSDIQYGRVLDRIIREVVIAEPALVPIYILNTDVSNGFYRIGLPPTDVPNMGLVLLLGGSGEELVAIPLILPMGC